MTHRPTGSEPWERPAPADRAAHSDAIERRIRTAAARIADPGLRRLLEGTLPNTLDTTIVAGGSDERPDTFVLTGDIDAMWLRDSSAQVWPYLTSVRGRCRSRPADPWRHPPPERPDPARPVRERVPVRRQAQRVGRRPDRDAPGGPRTQVGAGLPARVLPPLGRIRERQPARSGRSTPGGGERWSWRFGPCAPSSDSMAAAPTDSTARTGTRRTTCRISVRALRAARTGWSTARSARRTMPRRCR